MQKLIETKKREQQADYRIRKIANKLIRRTSKLGDEVLSEMITLDLGSENIGIKTPSTHGLNKNGSIRNDNIGVFISP